MARARGRAGVEARSSWIGDRFLLDTHVWIWYVEGDEARVPRAIVDTIESAATVRGVLVSAMSIWEVAMLEAGRRLQLSVDVRVWVARALSQPALRLKGLTPGIAIESARLPGSFHGDPADRILVATARRTGATLVTRDARILEYASAGHCRVLDATS